MQRAIRLDKNTAEDNDVGAGTPAKVRAGRAAVRSEKMEYEREVQLAAHGRSRIVQGADVVTAGACDRGGAARDMAAGEARAVHRRLAGKDGRRRKGDAGHAGTGHGLIRGIIGAPTTAGDARSNSGLGQLGMTPQSFVSDPAQRVRTGRRTSMARARRLTLRKPQTSWS